MLNIRMNKIMALATYGYLKFNVKRIFGKLECMVIHTIIIYDINIKIFAMTDSLPHHQYKYLVSLLS